MTNRRAVALVGGCIAVLLGFATAIYLVMQRSGAFLAARDCVYSSPSVRRVIGSPNTVVILPFNSRIRLGSGGQGDAMFTLFLKGDHGDAIGYAKVTETVGIWNVASFQVQTRGTRENIGCGSGQVSGVSVIGVGEGSSK